MFRPWTDPQPRSSVRALGARARHARGLTLIELMIAMSIMVMIVAGLSALAKGVQMSFEHGEGYGAVTQHARVVLDRMARIVNEAHASEEFPGFIVLAEYEGTWRFPDTLVVWHPSGTPADPTGRPRCNELVIFCPAPDQPNQLLEITVPNDSTVAPAASDTAGWLSWVQAIQGSYSAEKVCLTNLLRTAVATEGGSTQKRGAVRFDSRLLPSDSEWSQYQAGNLTWKGLSWVQGIYGPQTGLRQAWVRMELQLVPTTTTSTGVFYPEVVPFFGSAAVYYTLSSNQN